MEGWRARELEGWLGWGGTAGGLEGLGCWRAGGWKVGRRVGEQGERVRVGEEGWVGDWRVARGQLERAGLRGLEGWRGWVEGWSVCDILR